MDSLPEDLARFVSERSWTNEQCDDFECSREVARTIVLHCGWCEWTDCLISFWIFMTKMFVLKAKIQADDLTMTGMGTLPSPALGLIQLKELNVYQKKIMKDEVATFEKTVDLLYATVDAFWLSQQCSNAEELFSEIRETLDHVTRLLNSD